MRCAWPASSSAAALAPALVRGNGVLSFIGKPQSPAGRGECPPQGRCGRSDGGALAPAPQLFQPDRLSLLPTGPANSRRDRAGAATRHQLSAPCDAVMKRQRRDCAGAPNPSHLRRPISPILSAPPWRPPMDEKPVNARPLSDREHDELIEAVDEELELEIDDDRLDDLIAH